MSVFDPNWSDKRVWNYLRELGCWSANISIEPLAGGLCNRSFVVTDSASKYVARIGTDIPVHGIIQTSVHTSMIVAAQIGVSPQVQYSEQGLAILDFLPGGCLRPQDMESNNINLERIATALRKVHQGSSYVNGALTYFWPFQVIRNYARVGQQKQSRLISLLPEVLRINNILEQSIKPYQPVFTHNDTVPQNFMFDNDSDIWIIDWDYGGYGHPMFDLVGVSCNADLSEKSEKTLFEMYYGTIDYELEHQLIAFKLALNLREYMWGMVQEVTSDLDSANVAASMTELYPDQEPGYEGYTDLNRERFEANWKLHRKQFE